MTTLRILDANLNRAREGLRTCEEYARLVLDDARSAECLKAARRALQECSDALGSRRLLAARDIRGDVGARPQADDVTRAGPADVALAGIKRAQEALRVIEEFSQLESRAAAAAAARARYAAYEAEQQLFVAAPRRALLRANPVMVVFTRALCARPWRDVLQELLGAGAKLFQLREKQAEAREFAEFAAEFIELAPGACVIINDRADLAALAGDGVHLGQQDLPVADARRVVGPAALVGVSTHNVTEALRAEADEADYIGAGSMFATATKQVQSMAGPGLIRELAGRVNIPVFPIGGITPGNVRQLAQAGAKQVAVSAAVLTAERPADAYRGLVEALLVEAAEESA